MIKKIFFENTALECRESESVLDALLRQGKEVPFSCRNGVCHACLMQAVEGEPGEQAQSGLADHLSQKNYFLPCRCHPQQDLTIALPRPADLSCLAIVQTKQQLNERVWRFEIEPSVELSYHAGQFINIRNTQGVVRSYSIASVPHQDYYLELHINRHDQGLMSRWLIDHVEVGDEIELTRPDGHNFYQTNQHTPLLLAGSGTGVAPLIGIARDALFSGHQAEVHLYHGAADEQGIYLQQTLRSLEQQFEHFHFHSCVMNEQNIEQSIATTHKTLSGWNIHIAGNPQMVDSVAELVRQLGGDESTIFTDPFTLREVTSSDLSSDATEQNSSQEQETDYPPPDPELWLALGEGEILKKIVDDFYDAIFEDPIMSPYFHNSTKTRAREKVYSFYRRLFSGDRVYFGDRPRNAHHWMVISDDVFNYREALLKSFMQKHGLSNAMILRWQALEELYRSDIVKSKPRGRRIGDIETPAEGYGKITLSVAGMCDTCYEEIENGTEVIYHLRTGNVFCAKCSTVQQD
jgi:ferredoxin-NADP reductase/ferredoxin